MSVTMTPSTGGITGSSVFCDGLNIHTLYKGGAVLTAGSARRVAVHGTIAAVVASSNRHCDQLTSIRPVLSHSGNAELKRPPGEGPGTSITLMLWVARVCAGPG